MAAEVPVVAQQIEQAVGSLQLVVVVGTVVELGKLSLMNHRPAHATPPQGARQVGYVAQFHAPVFLGREVSVEHVGSSDGYGVGGRVGQTVVLAC